MKNGLAALGVVCAVVALIFVLTGWSADSNEKKLRNAFTARQKANEARFDTLWKTVSSKAQVAEKERESFRTTMVEIMQSQRGVAGNGQLASFFTQAGVTVSNELFVQLSTAIEAQRETFYRDQEQLLKLKEQHDNVLATYPSAFFVGGRPPLEAKLVTSAKTEEAFQTGQENDVHIFGEAPPEAKKPDGAEL